jgi:predicted ester cyclase
MSVEENKAIIRRYIEIGWSKGDMDVVGESAAPTYVRHQPNMAIAVESSEALKTLIGIYRAGVPDLNITVEHLVAEGDWVSTRVRCTGTHTGELAGIPPTGRNVDFTASDIFKMSGGRIVASWHNVDDLGLLQQLGVLPAP